MTKTKTTIQEVAQHAGVSMMTVSRVIREPESVAEDTRLHVQKLIRELNYSPRRKARKKESPEKDVIGLLLANPESGYGTQFLLSAMRRCHELGFYLVLETCDEDVAVTLRSVDRLIHHHDVAGIVLLQPMADMLEVLHVLNEAEMPYVRVAPDKELRSSPYVCMDDYSAAFEMTSRLIELGHQHIGFIMGRPEVGAARLRYQGYLDALRSKQLISPPEFIEQGYFDYASAIVAAEKLLGLSDRPSAIFASNDDMALAVIAVANRHHLQVPHDLSVVGFDDTQLAIRAWPTLSTVRQPIADMAEEAINILFNTNKDKVLEAAQYRVVKDYSLVFRESTAKYSVT